MNSQTRDIDYDSDCNRHSHEGARAALGFILRPHRVKSLLDVGCGPGAWVAAAVQAGVPDVCGVDGISPAQGLCSPARFIEKDLRTAWSLGRRFDLVLCLEVAEHLEEAAASVLVSSLCAHSDLIAFSAAIPGQPGQHHVNCQWPGYWQALFNKHGFSCSDAIRWDLWNEEVIEPWYRQNLFIASKSADAGAEPRIQPVVHPVIHTALVQDAAGGNGLVAVLKKSISRVIARTRTV